MNKLLIILSILFSSSVFAEVITPNDTGAVNPSTSNQSPNIYPKNYENTGGVQIIPSKNDPKNNTQVPPAYMPTEGAPNDINYLNMFNQDTPPLPNAPNSNPNAGVQIETQPRN